MIEILKHVTTLLKSLSSSAVTFATADNSIAATGIGTAFPAGKKIVVSGAAQAGNNITFTVVSATSGKIIVSETVTAESAGAAVVINEEYQSGYVQVFDMDKIVGHINSSQNCTVYLDFSGDKSNAYTIDVGVAGGVAAPIDQSVKASYLQVRIRNGGTDQTTMEAFIYGQKGA